MPRVCTICTHPQRHGIEAEVGRASLSDIVRRYGVKIDPLRRHRDRCMQDKLARRAEIRDFTAREVMLELVRDLRELAASCREAAPRDYLLVADRLSRAAEVMGKITGEIAPPNVAALFVSVGVRDEADLRRRLSLSEPRDFAPDADLEEALALLKICLVHRPQRRQYVLNALSSEAHELTNGHTEVPPSEPAPSDSTSPSPRVPD
jgi:hypothetical protein